MLEHSLVLLYIDPGMGFITLHILAASLLGLTFYFRSKTTQILKNLRLIFRRKTSEESERLQK